jgi:hypothetical protein
MKKVIRPCKSTSDVGGDIIIPPPSVTSTMITPLQPAFEHMNYMRRRADCVRLTPPAMELIASSSTPTIGISLNPVQARLVGSIKLPLNLFNAISACHQKTGQDKGIALFFGSFKLLPRLLAQPNIPRFSSFITPMEMFGGSKDVSIQTQGFLSMRSEPGGDRFPSWHPNIWRHRGQSRRNKKQYNAFNNDTRKQ